MKKTISVLITLIPAIAFAQDGKYEVTGTVGTYNTPAKMYLQYVEKGKVMTDSVTMKDGQFHFNGKVGGTPMEAYLVLNAEGNGVKYRDYKSIYLEEGVIKVNSSDSLKKATVDGPKTNQDNARLQAALKHVNDEYDALEAKQNAATPEQKKSDAFQHEINKEEKAIEDEEAGVDKKFIQDNPDSYISLNALETYAYSADYADIAPLYNGLSDRIKQTENGKKFAERLPKMKAVALGQEAPLFTEADTAGKMVSLESFRGKYVLVDFWASWCGPCRAENPNVVRAFNKYKDKNFTILSVSLDRPNGKQRWLDAIHKDGLTWTHVSDLQFWKSKVADMYGVRAIPANFLLDPNGKIIAKNLRGDDLEDKLADIFSHTNSTN
ncbi:MAG TPA: TlpA disulfide reductase family protein [Mucilaginibacter sp.]|nr:TlpA disulfide reductase family protein [Mucilaginibacter sp.]